MLEAGNVRVVSVQNCATKQTAHAYRIWKETRSPHVAYSNIPYLRAYIYHFTDMRFKTGSFKSPDKAKLVLSFPLSLILFYKALQDLFLRCPTKHFWTAIQHMTAEYRRVRQTELQMTCLAMLFKLLIRKYNAANVRVGNNIVTCRAVTM
jgi:hypothetical protein